MHRPSKAVLQKIGVAAVYLIVWEGLALLVGKSLLLPGPVETVTRLIALLSVRASWQAAGMTLLRIVAGYAMGVACGVLLAVLTAWSRTAELLLAPLRGVVKATPVTSIILLALLWLGSNVVPVWISFLMVVPIVWTNVAEAIVGTDAGLLEMARAFRFGRGKTLRNVYVPSVRPSFLAACTTSLGFAWKSGVAAEIIAQPKHSVGGALYLSKLTLETADLFAWTLLVILLSMALEAALVRVLGRARK